MAQTVLVAVLSNVLPFQEYVTPDVVELANKLTQVWAQVIEPLAISAAIGGVLSCEIAILATAVQPFKVAVTSYIPADTQGIVAHERVAPLLLLAAKLMQVVVQVMVVPASDMMLTCGVSVAPMTVVLAVSVQPFVGSVIVTV